MAADENLFFLSPLPRFGGEEYEVQTGTMGDRSGPEEAGKQLTDRDRLGARGRW